MAWRQITDWAKKNDQLLRFADRLGRGTGRQRLLDHVGTPPRPRRPDLHGWDAQALAAIWIGHSTLLLRVGGKTILTDPVFSNRIGLDLGIVTGGPRRHRAPALQINELPAIDLVLVSHAHFDHLDRPSLRLLPKTTPIITALHTSDLIEDLGFVQVQELRWNQFFELDGLTITAREVDHWGARTISDWHRGYNAYLIASPEHRVLYGADTAYGPHFSDLGGVDLAILGIGGYDPYVAAHATPEQALDMADQAGARRILPMHHSTFRLSHEPMEEPLARLMAASSTAQSRIVVREVGGQWSLDN